MACGCDPAAPSNPLSGIVKLGGSDKVPRSVAGSSGQTALARAHHLASIKEGKVELQQSALVNLTMPRGVILTGDAGSLNPAPSGGESRANLSFCD
jgi:hypothetical protein